MKRIPFNQLQDKQYGRLTILSEHFGTINIHGKPRRMFLCKCECGNESIVGYSNLIYGITRSCGCLMKEKTASLKFTHGLHDHPLYARWKGMKVRCYNKNAIQYCDWGGRGIIICDEWKNNFKTFYDWAITSGYKKELHLDRINNDGNYEPTNCRFVTQAQNNKNKRKANGYLKLEVN